MSRLGPVNSNRPCIFVKYIKHFDEQSIGVTESKILQRK